MASKYEGRLADLESRLKVKLDIHERLAEYERSIAHMPPKLQHDRMRQFYLHCTDQELEELMGLGANPPRWQIEALAAGATVQEIKRAARDEVLRAKMKVETRKRINLSVIDGDGQ